MRSDLEPREALLHSSMAVQTAGARALGKDGTIDDVLLLCDRAARGSGFGTRLACATAAVNILFKHKRASRGAYLDSTLAGSIREYIRFADADFNPGLYLLLSALQDEFSYRVLNSLLRDHRNSARVAGVSAVRRMVLSHGSFEDGQLQRFVKKRVMDGAVRPDVQEEMRKLLRDVGWGTAFPSRGAAASQPARDQIEGWEGIWVSYGVDVWSPSPSDCDQEWLVIGAGEIYRIDQSVHHGAFWLCGNECASHIMGGPMRLVRAPRVEIAGGSLAVQIPGQTWYAATKEELKAFQKRAKVADLHWVPEILEAAQAGIRGDGQA